MLNAVKLSDSLRRHMSVLVDWSYVDLSSRVNHLPERRQVKHRQFGNVNKKIIPPVEFSWESHLEARHKTGRVWQQHKALRTALGSLVDRPSQKRIAAFLTLEQSLHQNSMTQQP